MTTSIRVDRETFDRLQELRYSQRRTVTALVREAVALLAASYAGTRPQAATAEPTAKVTQPASPDATASGEPNEQMRRFLERGGKKG